MWKNQGSWNSFHAKLIPNSSKNGEIEAYLSTRYEFRYNTVLGRTEYRSSANGDLMKVDRYEINTLRRELDNDVGIITSSDNLA